MRLHRPFTLMSILLLLLAAGCYRGAEETAKEIRAEAEGEALFAAARAGDVDEVRRLVEQGILVDAEDPYGATPLIMAANNGRIEVVRWLLEQGADPNHAESFYGADAVGMALFSGNLDVAALLLENGAEDRETALQVALSQGNVELARAAVEAGPIYVSSLETIRARAKLLGPELKEIVERATPRPDPAPPELTAEELQSYVGRFEGQTSDTLVEVRVDGDHLVLSVNGGEPLVMKPTGEKAFSSESDDVQASFYGRAGTIEQINLQRPGAPPESLRHSVAEPAGPRAFRADAGTAAKPDEPTVNWPAFRGENALGIGDGADVPTSWDADKGEAVLWQTDLPGLGNSSPVVWGDQVFITTAVAEGVEQRIRTGLTGSGEGVDEEVEHVWKVLAFDKRSGEQLWETEIGRAVPLTRRHFKATQANSTPVTNGEHLVVVFPTAGAACLGLDGSIHWRHELGGLNAGAFTDPGTQWGYASSPVLYESRVILQVDVHEGQYLAAWELRSGEQAWRVERDVAPSWATPAVLRDEGGDELVVNGSTIHGYDPRDGNELWSLGPNSELVIATPVVGDGVVYVSAGYPPVKPIYAVPAGTRGDLDVDPGGVDKRLLWSHNRGGAYMPTPLLYRGIFYVVHHNGRFVAYDAAGGTPIYKQRPSQGGTFTASPVAANGKLYMPTEEGQVYVVEAGPEYRELAVNEMGEPLMATPAISEGILLIRTPTRLVAVGHRSRG